jgi:hypothetical protein
MLGWSAQRLTAASRKQIEGGSAGRDAVTGINRKQIEALRALLKSLHF